MKISYSFVTVISVISRIRASSVGGDVKNVSYKNSVNKFLWYFTVAIPPPFT